VETHGLGKTATVAGLYGWIFSGSAAMDVLAWAVIVLAALIVLGFTLAGIRRVASCSQSVFAHCELVADNISPYA
jgi:hypothetical protein